MYSPRFEAALQLASVRHHAQQRKGGGIPYITHLMHVAWLVAQDGGDEDTMIVALLHDVIEDTAKTKPEIDVLTEELIRRFGPEITRAIQSLSEPKRDGTGERLPWRDRKIVYLSQVKSGAPMAHRVSAADKLHNLATLNEDLAREGPVVWQRFSAGAADTLWFYRSAAELLQPLLPQSRLVTGLGKEVEILARGAGLTGS